MLSKMIKSRRVATRISTIRGRTLEASQVLLTSVCHMASPFLHSLAVDQLKNPEDTTKLLVPITGDGPYSIVGAEFGPLFDADIDNSCTSCLRSQCTETWQNYPLDELQMPAPFTKATSFDYSSISNADRQAIRDWCATLDLK